MTKDKIVFISGIFLALVVVSASGLLAFLKYSSNGIKQNVSTIESPAPTPIATPMSSDVKPDYKNEDILVLNGSGVTGAAGKFASSLKSQGYLHVTTGNYEEIITGNLLFAPTDFGGDITLENYKFEKSEAIKVVIGK